MTTINIKTSEENKFVIAELKGKLPAGTHENFIARIALAYSLASGRKFDLGKKSEYDSKGKEYKDHILFDPSKKKYFIGLICQHYNIHRSDTGIPKYVKLHIDDGIEKIGRAFKDQPSLTFMEFLMEQLDAGLEHLNLVDTPIGHVQNKNQKVQKSYFSDPLEIEVARRKAGEPISMRINDTSQFKTMHIAIAGKSGTGKTQFALYFLSEIVKLSGHKVNFAFLDFKGVNSEDAAKLKPFLTETEATLIDSPATPFPINPLAFIDNVNEQDRIMGINKFVDILSDYENLGANQKQTLKIATKEAFLDQTGGKFPGLKDVYLKILDQYDDKRDTLTELNR